MPAGTSIARRPSRGRQASLNGIQLGLKGLEAKFDEIGGITSGWSLYVVGGQLTFYDKFFEVEKYHIK
jgi:hypothetical protein